MRLSARALKAPGFWWREPAVGAAAFAPLASLYGSIAGRRLEHGKRAELPVPVLCVGNPTLGGGGKTPAAIAFAAAARAEGFSPGIVSRGYGRSTKGTLLVDPASHSAREVGDEPLLLARAAPTAVSADRAKAAERLFSEAGCDFVIMDDGFQSARLATDHAVLVVDGRRGLGNWRVFPAGPLRAPLDVQLRHADTVLIVGSGEPGGAVASEAARRNRPVGSAKLAPLDGARLAGMKVLAFAGIADPGKFAASLRDCGADIQELCGFPDHHAYTEAQVAALSQRAWRRGLQLVTTAKDAARLETGSEPLRLFRAECEVLEVALAIDPPDLAHRIIRQTADACRRRRTR